MNIGLGLAAADSYFKEGDARRVREFEQARRDSELATMPDQTQARRSDYLDRIGMNSARAALRPGETQNAMTRQQVDSVRVGGELGRVGQEEQTKDAAVDYGLNAAKFKLGRQSQEQKTQGLRLDMAEKGTEADVEQLPRKLSMAAAQGILDQQGQSDMVLGTLGGLLARNDKATALKFSNAISKETGILPNSNGKTFTDITPEQGGEQGDGYRWHTSDGKSVFVPSSSIKGSMDKMKSGKYHFIHTNQGDVFAGNESNGSVKQVYAGDKKTAGAQHMGPLERDVNYLVNGHGMTQAQALSHLNSAKTMSKEQFVLKSMQDTLGMGKKPTDEDVAAFGQLYDSAVATKPQSNPSQKATLNNPAASTAARSLLGLP